MFERFSAEARQLVVNAVDWTHEFGDAHLGTEHLLLAATRDRGPCASALADVGAQTEKLMEKLGRPVAPLTDSRRSRTREIPFTPNAKKALNVAVGEADRNRREDR